MPAQFGDFMKMNLLIVERFTQQLVNMNALFPMLTMLAILLNFNCFYCYICIIRIGNTFNYATMQYWNDRSQLPEWDVFRFFSDW